ncbi:MAG TPA: HEAT repeat domain-containing protein, partial [Gemmataceae bacterium]
LEDTNGDGKADKVTTFADGLANPTGFEFYNGGVIVAQAPDLMFLKDTDGDGKADVRERLIHGLDTADTHHTANSFVLDPGGALYFQEGTFHHSQVEDPYGPPKRNANGGVYRYDPRTQKFDVYVTYGFANPHGHVFDKWGQDIVIDGTGAVPYHAPLFAGHLDYPQKHSAPPQVYQQRTRPSGGMEILSSQHFPTDFEGNLLVTNCIGFQGILRYKLSDSGSSLKGEELEPILSSTDPNFRPVDVKTGPDGAIWFIDWQNPIIGHMQHNLRDPNRDRKHGRIYRVTYEGQPLSVSPKIAGEPIEKLLELLKHPEDRVRYRARLELSGRKSDDVFQGIWESIKTAEIVSERKNLELLWLSQSHNLLFDKFKNPKDGLGGLLVHELKSQDDHVRAGAIRTLVYCRDRFPKSLELLKTAAADPSPRVRLMAIWAASFFTVPEAAEIVFIAQDQPTDQYITHEIRETMRALEPMLRKAIAEKREIKFTTASGLRHLVKMIDTDSLLKMDRTREVNAELLHRPGLRDELRREAITELAKIAGQSQLMTLLDAIRAQDLSDQTDESVTFDLFRLLLPQPIPDLPILRGVVEPLATKGKHPITRQLSFATVIAIDESTDAAWKLGGGSVRALQDLVAAMPLVRDPGQRAALYPKVVALLGGLPPELAKTIGAGKTVTGRYVRIELPGRQRTLTLAVVEVMSDGKNVALHKKARQSNTAYGGVASRAVDGNTDGSYGGGGQTHTREGTDNAWWEVDLGGEFPIETVIVYNRTDGNLGSRLNNFTLRVLDGDRREVFVSQRNPAPKVKSAVVVGTESPERIVRHSAMRALTSVRGKEAEAFAAIAKFVPDASERHSAIQALLHIPAKDWPKESAKPLFAEVVKYIRSLPAADRTTPAALDAMQFG